MKLGRVQATHIWGALEAYGVPGKRRRHVHAFEADTLVKVWFNAGGRKVEVTVYPTGFTHVQHQPIFPPGQDGPDWLEGKR